MRRGPVVVSFVLVAVAVAVLVAGCGGNGRISALQSRVLSVADLPAGWSSTPTNAKVTATNTPCFSSLSKRPRGLTYVTAAFVEGRSIPTLVEVLLTGPQTRPLWARFAVAMSRCRNATIDLAGTMVASTVRPIAFPRVAGTSSAYAWAFTFSGIRIGFDLVLFSVGRYSGYVTYGDLGPPEPATVTAFVTAAVTKATAASTARIPDGVSVASTPVHIAHTTMGAVAYRLVGAGLPLVLITGYSSTMEGWDPRLVYALAQHYRVVIFDNAGIGPTQSLPSPLTIDAMAKQTSALIQTLGLRRADVLGWSMGSMIAQALAVLDPAQVRRLILCAPYPGNGSTVRPSQQAIDALTSSNTQQALADLFPADQSAAQNTYLASLTSYPTAPPAPAATVTAQGHAIDGWWSGNDPAGQHATTITIPTLIADGTLDRLDPVENSRALAKLIPRATLKLYPDAGHAFLFQDQTLLVPIIEAFLH